MTPRPDEAIPLPTRDPFGRGELVVTRLESAETGVVIEGRFSLGWIGRLTREQLDLLGLLLVRRNNLQRLAADLDLAYNTVRARFEEIVQAVGAQGEPATSAGGAASVARAEVLRRVAAGELSVDDAASLLRRDGA